MIKVGDKVRLLGTKRNLGYDWREVSLKYPSTFFKGNILTIKSCNPTENTIDFVECDIYWFGIEDVELVDNTPRFKVGDKVFLKNAKRYGQIVSINTKGTLHLYRVGCYNAEQKCTCYSFSIQDNLFPIGNEFRANEVNKMELKDIKTSNLKEAFKQVQEEKATAEIKYAKEVLRANIDRKDTLLREIKVRQEEIAIIDEALKLFK